MKRMKFVTIDGKDVVMHPAYVRQIKLGKDRIIIVYGTDTALFSYETREINYE